MRQFGIIQVASAPIRSTDSDRAEIVSQLLFGEAVEIIHVDTPWIKIKCEHDSYEGYMDRKQVIFLSEDEFNTWKTVPKTRLLSRTIQVASSDGPEWIYQGSLIPSAYVNGFKLHHKTYTVLSTPFELTRHTSIVELAQSYLNTPYLWGGRSITGIDCSGYTQIVYAMYHFSLPRDASQQALVGKEIPFQDAQAGDLAFFHNSKKSIIHVGILTGMGSILHASGKVREDVLDEKGIFRKDFNDYTHQLTYIRRYI